MVAFLKVAVPFHNGLLVSSIAICLAGSSGLRPYDNFPGNSRRLAASGNLHSPEREGFDHLRPLQEQSLHFSNFDAGFTRRPTVFQTVALAELIDRNLPRCAAPVAPPPFGKRNTTHLLPLGLRPTGACFGSLSLWKTIERHRPCHCRLALPCGVELDGYPLSIHSKLVCIEGVPCGDLCLSVLS